MGRGRAKAKQAKVARKLKYDTPEMDISSLQKELSHQGHRPGAQQSDHYAGLPDPDYSAYADKYDDPDYSEYADKYNSDSE